jgi:preprotein translocase subunit SecG
LFTLLLALHIFISFLLVVVVLLQAGKGGGLASAFGGAGTSTDAVFGGRQAATFLTKATSVLGTIFFISSFGLALYSSYHSGPSSAVQQELQSSPMPVAPAPVAQPPAGVDIFQSSESQEAGSETQAQP